jgi:hypothetical protein
MNIRTEDHMVIQYSIKSKLNFDGKVHRKNNNEYTYLWMVLYICCKQFVMYITGCEQIHTGYI